MGLFRKQGHLKSDGNMTVIATQEELDSFGSGGGY